MRINPTLRKHHFLYLACRLLVFSGRVILVRLTKKLAECLDDVDLSKYQVGDLLELPDRDAGMLIAEGCAERVEQRRQQTDRRKHPPEGAAR